MNCLVVYRNSNNDYLYRFLKHSPVNYNIGDITTMNWLITDIQYYFNGRFYSRSHYFSLLDKYDHKDRKTIFFKNKIHNFFNFVLYHNFIFKRK